MSTCKPEFDEIRATAQKSLYDWEHYDYEAECRESADRQRASYLAHSGDADCEDFFPTIPLKSAGPLMVAYHPSVMLALVDERDALVAERDLLRESLNAPDVNTAQCAGSGLHSSTTAIIQGSGFVAMCPVCEYCVASSPAGYMKPHG